MEFTPHSPQLCVPTLRPSLEAGEGGDLVWHPEYFHTDQNKRLRLGSWFPGLVFLCVATVAFREYPVLLVWGRTGTLCKLYFSVPKCFMENKMIKTLS